MNIEETPEISKGHDKTSVFYNTNDLIDLSANRKKHIPTYYLLVNNSHINNYVLYDIFQFKIIIKLMNLKILLLYSYKSVRL